MSSTSSSRSARSAAGKSAAKSPMNTMLTWCSQHRYVVLGTVLGVIVLGVFVIGNPSSPSVVAKDDTDSEEFSDLGLEEELSVDKDKPTRSASGFTPVTSVRPAPSAEFADLTLNFGGQSTSTSGVVGAAYEGALQPSFEAPVWLAGTIETDDDIPAFAFPSSAEIPLPHATGPILMPQ